MFSYLIEIQYYYAWRNALYNKLYIYLGILFKTSRGPNVSGHFDPDRHGLLSRANGELVGRRQRRPTLPS